LTLLVRDLEPSGNLRVERDFFLYDLLAAALTDVEILHGFSNGAIASDSHERRSGQRLPADIADADLLRCQLTL
jgi:hypothetical protein